MRDRHPGWDGWLIPYIYSIVKVKKIPSPFLGEGKTDGGGERNRTYPVITPGPRLGISQSTPARCRPPLHILRIALQRSCLLPSLGCDVEGLAKLPI